MANRKIKCLVVGDKKADKVCLLKSYTTGQYPTVYKPTVFENYHIDVELSGKPYTLSLWCPGTEDDAYDRLRRLDYPDTNVLVICFSLIHPESFENVKVKWVPEVKQYCPNIPMLLVGTKLEKREDRAKIEKLRKKGLKPITYEEGLQLQREIGAVTYHECSGKTREGLTEVFDDAVRAAKIPFIFTDSERHLKEALKDGYIPHKDDLFLIHGPGGVGKSSLISMFLGKKRDLTRVSTAVAEESLHLCPVRDVSTSTFTDKWELVDINRQSRMIAHTSYHLLSKKMDISVSVDVPTGSEEVDGDENENEEENQHHKQQKGDSEHSSAFLKSRKGFPRIASRAVSKFSSMFKKSLTKSLGDDPEHIEIVLSDIQHSLQNLMHQTGKSLDLMLYYSIRLLDSGGQPQFHEVVSIVLPTVTGIISVFKLSERLDAHGEVVFYKEGVQGNDPYVSYLTNEQVIRHDLLAIQSVASRSENDEIPSVAFVGTFLDQQDACTDESPDQKDKLLQSMITEILPKELQQCVISNGESLQHVTFRVNARTPSDTDYEMAKRLKDALMSQSQVKPRNLPLKWFSYEVALRKLMEKLGRQTLTMQECEFVGFKLHFDLPSLRACLSYLRELHIISYYDFLPHVIFGSCQVILDKITELISYSLELKKGNRPLTGVERKFHQQGILSLKFLQSDACSKHYNKHFTQESLLTILKSLFIITNVGPEEYLMPCVLEVNDIYPSPRTAEQNIQSSFVLHFSKKSPMVGIYCCTISYLFTKSGWKLLHKGGEVVQLARNSVIFQLPQNLPGKIILLDPISSYLEVVLERPSVAADESSDLYHEICNTLFAAIEQAMQTLKYKVRTPELSFLCPEQSSQCSTYRHIAIVNASHRFLTCSISPDTVAHPLTLDQKMWLECSRKEKQTQRPQKRPTAPLLSIKGEQPTLPQLIEIDLPSRVGEKFQVFGTLLLQDEYGNKMENITEECRGKPERITMHVLMEWLAGKGVEVSWESLISILRKSKLQLMADQLQIALDQLKS